MAWLMGGALGVGVPVLGETLGFLRPGTTGLPFQATDNLRSMLFSGAMGGAGQNSGLMVPPGLGSGLNTLGDANQATSAVDNLGIVTGAGPVAGKALGYGKPGQNRAGLFNNFLARNDSVSPLDMVTGQRGNEQHEEMYGKKGPGAITHGADVKKLAGLAALGGLGAAGGAIAGGGAAAGAAGGGAAASGGSAPATVLGGGTGGVVGGSAVPAGAVASTATPAASSGLGAAGGINNSTLYAANAGAGGAAGGGAATMLGGGTGGVTSAGAAPAMVAGDAGGAALAGTAPSSLLGGAAGGLSGPAIGAIAGGLLGGGAGIFQGAQNAKAQKAAEKAAAAQAAALKKYLADLKKAQEEANRENKKRYAQLLDQQNDLRARTDANLGKLGRTERSDINRAFKRQGGTLQQSLFSRGLGGSTVKGTMERANERERRDSMGRLEDRLANQRIQTDMSLTGSLGGIIERRNDTAMPLNPGLASQAGAAAGFVPSGSGMFGNILQSVLLGATLGNMGGGLFGK